MPAPGADSVVRTVYSFGVSGDHKVIWPRPVRLMLVAVVPVRRRTVRVAAASLLGPSSSSAVTSAGESGAAAASMVTCTSTRRPAVSTSAGQANTSARKTCGTTRSAASR